MSCCCSSVRDSRTAVSTCINAMYFTICSSSVSAIAGLRDRPLVGTATRSSTSSPDQLAGVFGVAQTLVDGAPGESARAATPERFHLGPVPVPAGDTVPVQPEPGREEHDHQGHHPEEQGAEQCHDAR